MHFIHRFIAVVPILILTISTDLAHATYSEKTIRISAPLPTGGAVDSVTCKVTNHLTQVWKTSVIVDNKTDAGDAIGVDQVAKVTKTAYELLSGPVGSLTSNLLWRQVVIESDAGIN
jgi:tripartite-type tricarboxylate transporter receptor subunit TctC